MDNAVVAVVSLAMIIGVVEFVKALFDMDWKSAAIILAAAVTGGVLGFFGVEGLTVLTGAVLGFGAVGVHTTASRIG